MPLPRCLDSVAVGRRGGTSPAAIPQRNVETPRRRDSAPQSPQPQAGAAGRGGVGPHSAIPRRPRRRYPMPVREEEHTNAAEIELLRRCRFARPVCVGWPASGRAARSVARVVAMCQVDLMLCSRSINLVVEKVFSSGRVVQFSEAGLLADAELFCRPRRQRGVPRIGEYKARGLQARPCSRVA